MSFPVYDGHGNMICTVARNTGTIGYSVQNVKRYDVWGGVRSDSGASSSTSGGHLANTDKRYCANLGHATDIETGLIYMRARYYEPTTGRFISQDPAMDGKNWYIYCENLPVVGADPSGTIFILELGCTISDQMRLRAAQASMMFQALSRLGDKIKDWASFSNLRLQYLVDDCYQTFDDITNTDIKNELDDIFFNSGGSDGWQKIMTRFVIEDVNSGNRYSVRIHMFGKPGTDLIANPNIKDIVDL